VLVACGSGTRDGESTSRPEGSDATAVEGVETSDSVPDGVDGSFDQSTLAAEPSFVEPQVDPVRSVELDVSAVEGGSLSLPLSPDVVATLDIPPGALDQDHTVIMSAVTSLGDDDPNVLGVDIQPAGLWFRPDAMPRLSFDGVSNDSTIVGWNDDGVAEIMAALPTSDDGLVVGMTHFSGAAVSSRIASVTNAVDHLGVEIRSDLKAEQYRQFTGTDDPEVKAEVEERWKQRFAEVDANFIRPMLTAIASGPCGYQAEDALRIAVSLVQQAGILVVPYQMDSLLVEKVIDHEKECARQACRDGNPTAGGRFVTWGRWSWLLGLDDGTISDEDFQLFSTCVLYRVTVMGKTLLRFPTGDLGDAFVTKGVVALEASGDPKDPGRINRLPLTITTGGVQPWDTTIVSTLFQGLAAAMGGGGGPVEECTFEPIGPSVAQVDVSLAQFDPSTPELEPMVRFKPFVFPGTRSCAGFDFPYAAEVTFASHVAFRSFIFNGIDIRHDFKASERDSFGVYRKSETIDLGPLLAGGLSGTSSLLMNVQHVAHFQPLSGEGLKTDLLVDAYAVAAGA
jgi:hypothetical protein